MDRKTKLVGQLTQLKVLVNTALEQQCKQEPRSVAGSDTAQSVDESLASLYPSVRGSTPRGSMPTMALPLQSSTTQPMNLGQMDSWNASFYIQVGLKQSLGQGQGNKAQVKVNQPVGFNFNMFTNRLDFIQFHSCFPNFEIKKLKNFEYYGIVYIVNKHSIYMVIMHQSIPSANIPPSKPAGKFFEAVKSPAPVQNFSAKARPLGQENTYPGEDFERPSQLFLLIGVEILEFCRNQTLKRTGRLSKSGGTIIMRSAIPENAIPRNYDPHQKSTKMRSQMY